MLSIWLRISIQNYKYFASKKKSRMEAIRCYLRIELFYLSRLVRVGLQRHHSLLNVESKSISSGLYFTAHTSLDLPPWTIHQAEDIEDISVLANHHLIDREYLSELQQANFPSSLEEIEFEELATFMASKLQFSDLAPQQQSSNKQAIYIHLYYPDLWASILPHINKVREEVDILITVPNFTCVKALVHIANSRSNIRFFQTENIGRDVYPFLRLLTAGVFDNYDAVCKLHTKKSLHTSIGNEWMENTLNALLGTSDNIHRITQAFKDKPQLGVLGPEQYLIPKEVVEKERLNNRFLKIIMEELKIPESTFSYNYFAGTMFWFRPSALSQLKKLELDINMFPNEMKQTDGTIMHGFERLFNTIAAFSNYRVETEKEQA